MVDTNHVWADGTAVEGPEAMRLKRNLNRQLSVAVKSLVLEKRTETGCRDNGLALLQ